MNKKTLLAIIVASIIIAPTLVLAASTSTPLRFSPPYVSGVPGFAGASQDPITYGTSIQVYLVRIYQFAIGISGITAVGMIVYGAINMSIYTGRIDKYEDGKTMIYDALWGLALLFGSYLLLQTINPNIVQLHDIGVGTPTLAAPTSTLAKVPKSDTACGGGDLAKVPLYPPGITPSIPVANGCEFRRLKLTQNIKFNASNDSMYDQGINLDAGSIVWLWPYYTKNTSDAKCVIYAAKAVPYDEKCAQIGEGSCAPSGNIITPATLPVKLRLDKLSKCTNDPSTQQPGVECPDCGVPGGSADVSGINISNLDSNGSCAPSFGTSPAGIVNDIKLGKPPLICYPGCNSASKPCTSTGATLSAGTISTIMSLQSSGMSFTITSLTGGSHQAVGDVHYQGRALDVVFSPQDAATWNKALKLLQKMSTVSQAACEFIGGSPPNFDTNSCDGLFAAGTTNRHIHVTTQ